MIPTSRGAFTADVSGRHGGELVLLLHGYPQSRHTWRHQLPTLGRFGYLAVAIDQRGYSPRARPDPSDIAAYAIEQLIDDVLAIAEMCTGLPERFHLVGHDWGGQVAWVLAARYPERLASLMVLSRPHPAAFRRAFREDADSQRHRSRHHLAFRDAAMGPRLLDNDAAELRKLFADNGVPPAAIAEYLSVVGTPEAMEAALAWYRSAGALGDVQAGPVSVPTLYLWGEEDATVGASAARWTADFVTGPYHLDVLPGIGHFITDQVPEIVTSRLLQHVAANAISK